MRFLEICVLALMSLAVMLPGARAEPLNLIVIDEGKDLLSALGQCERARDWEGYPNNSALLEKGCGSDGYCLYFKMVLHGCKFGDIGKFQKELTAQFLTQPNCKGVRIAQLGYDNPEKLDWMKKPHWTLNVDITPGETKHVWHMKPSDYEMRVSSSPPQGEGTAVEIVADVCAIAAQRGAEVVK